MQPYFFFSYARRDRRQDTDAFIDRFHDDLCAELGRLEPAARVETSYRDTDRLILGDDWERELAAVLAQCRTMVALYSPAYFASKYCGKEWTAFHGRVRRHHELTGSLVPALIPVLWEPPTVELPGEVAAIQYVEPAMSEPYAKYGLRHLLRTDPTGEDYRRVVRVVAGRVKDAAARQLTELPMFDLGAIRGYFPSRSPLDTMAGESAGLVRLFIAAGTAGAATTAGAAAAGATASGGWYGVKPWNWAPYHPPTSPGLAARAQQVIAAAGHATTLDEVSTSLPGMLDQAREDNQVSILLVDPWAAASEKYAGPLAVYDGQNHPVTGVMIPAGTSEPAPGAARDALWNGVRQVFNRNWLQRSGPEQLFRVRVGREDFDDQLIIMVTVAQNKLMDANSVRPGEDSGLDPIGLGPVSSGPAMPGLTIPPGPGEAAPGPGEATNDDPDGNSDPRGDDDVE